jgi:hypothetical protein
MDGLPIRIHPAGFQQARLKPDNAGGEFGIRHEPPTTGSSYEPKRFYTTGFPGGAFTNSGKPSLHMLFLGTEFLGACWDNYDFEERNLLGLRFRGAVKALYPHGYHQYADLLAAHLRNGFAPQFRPGTSR